jgi:diacylglycerol kinase (ATP)
LSEQPPGDLSEGSSRPASGSSPDRAAEASSDRSRHGLLESFNYAISGIVWALRHERNMQIHFGLAVIVIVMAVVFGVSREELLLIFAAITFVIVAELINTAIEYTVDLLTEKKQTPAAKVAKDVAAGAVFIASLNAIVVAYLVFYDHIVRWPYRFFFRLRVSPVDITVVALALVSIIVLIVKASVGRGTFLRGGWPSGHAAVAFAAWVAVSALAVKTAYATPISAVAFVMAFLTAQSRVQTGVHRPLEVIAGALLGTVVMVAVLAAFKPF